MLRKILWRTDIGFHRRKDSRTGDSIFSAYPDPSPIKVWDYDYWISDQWDPMNYGREYDWNEPFLEQFHELIKESFTKAITDVIEDMKGSKNV